MQTSLVKTPFVYENVKKMRWIGLAAIILGISTIIMKYAGMDFLAENVESNLISFNLGDYSAYESGYMFGSFVGSFFRFELILGLISLFGAEILSYGIKLQQENELTI